MTAASKVFGSRTLAPDTDHYYETTLCGGGGMMNSGTVTIQYVS